MAENSFWQFPHCAKYDEIKEERHAHLLVGALSDRETNIEKVDRDTFSLYGKDEALLIRPVSFVVRIGLELYRAFLVAMSNSR